MTPQTSYKQTTHRPPVPFVVENNSVVVFGSTGAAAQNFSVVRINSKSPTTNKLNRPHIAELVDLLVTDLGFNSTKVATILTSTSCSNVFSFVCCVRSTELGLPLDLSETELCAVDRETDQQIAVLIIQLTGSGYRLEEVLDAICVDKSRTVADALAVLGSAGKIHSVIHQSDQFRKKNSSRHFQQRTQVCLNALTEEEGHLVTAYRLDTLSRPHGAPGVPQFYIPHPKHFREMGRTNVLRHMIQCQLECGDMSQLSTRELREILHGFIHATYVI